jgi:YVTN family beta-propeller protein
LNLKSRLCLFPALLLGCVLVATGRAQYLEAVVPVGLEPTDVLWNPTSNKVYTTNRSSGSVTVIDGASNQVTATVTVAGDPTFLCWNPVANKVYCLSLDPDWLYVIDGVGDTLVRKVRMRGDPVKMVYNSTMNKLYVICQEDDMVRVYDGSADTLVAEVWFGHNMPSTLLWHPVSNRVFVATWGDSDSVFVIDCATDQVVNRLQAASRMPLTWSWNPLSNLVYVGSDRTVSVLTADGDSVVTTIPGCGQVPWSACHVPYQNKLYVGDFNSEGVVLIDCHTQSLYDTILDGQQINDMLCDTLHGKVYVVGMWDVYIFDARTDTLIKSIHAANGYEKLAWNSTNSRVYVADDAANAVYVIRDTTTGVAEDRSMSMRYLRVAPTATRGWLDVRGDGPSVLLDALGRRVASLSPGRNDLRKVGAGVYFLYQREGGRECVTKVILAR